MSCVSFYVGAAISVFSFEEASDALSMISSINALLNSFSSSSFFKILSNPRIKAPEKCDLILSLKGFFDDKFLVFLCILISNGRGVIIPEVLKRFIVETKHKFRIVDLKIYSAVPLPEKTMNRFIDSTKVRYLNLGDVENKVDSSILGGIIAVIGSRVLDFSLKSRLNKILDLSRAQLSDALRKY